MKLVIVKALFGTLLVVGCVNAHPAQADPQIIVNEDGSSDLYECEEDSPPPCVWDCASMGNRRCGEN